MAFEFFGETAPPMETREGILAPEDDSHNFTAVPKRAAMPRTTVSAEALTCGWHRLWEGSSCTYADPTKNSYAKYM